jgi:hypothetical protein
VCELVVVVVLAKHKRDNAVITNFVRVRVYVCVYVCVCVCAFFLFVCLFDPVVFVTNSLSSYGLRYIFEPDERPLSAATKAALGVLRLIRDESQDIDTRSPISEYMWNKFMENIKNTLFSQTISSLLKSHLAHLGINRSSIDVVLVSTACIACF